MTRILFTFFVLFVCFCGVWAQVRPKTAPAKTAGPAVATPAATPVPEPRGTVDPGKVAGKSYTNAELGFKIVFPESWLIPDDEFVNKMKADGYEKVKVPTSADPQSKANIRRFEKNVTLLLTAYSAFPRKPKDAMLRITAEDISDNPKIEDAVDYFDLMRAQIGTMKLPPDFEYSLVDAEKLGSMQFAFLDTSSKEGKRRMYATVRGKYAIMFTLTYTSHEDLAAFRRILEESDFRLKTR